ncbi:MAG: right-handed parallel beta-helix repeat-containing protein [bacterium]|nr:right-handed parallel beta-helix repeat-containing protein [bacterium]
MKRFIMLFVILLSAQPLFSLNLNLNQVSFKKNQVNPVLTPKGYKWESRCVYTPAVITNNGQYHMFYRGQDWRDRYLGWGYWNISYGISSVGHAVSSDGRNFTRYTNPAVSPTEGSYDDRGCEDPRIACINGRYYITYNGYSTSSPSTKICLASSADLVTWVKHGEISGSGLFNSKKHGALLAQKINNVYWMYYGDSDLWAATNRNEPPTTSGTPWSGWALANNGNPVMLRRGGYFDSDAIRSGPPPFINNGDIALIYNGITQDAGLTANPRFKGPFINEIGWVTFSNTNPVKIKERCSSSFIKVTKFFEQIGNVYNSVFASGMVDFGTNFFLYYGAADWCIAMGEGKGPQPAIPRNYYVNDTSTSGDSWCSAPGSDDNDGLSPGAPMRSLAALLDSYAMCGGSVVYVDKGSYPEGNISLNNITNAGGNNYFIIRGTGNTSSGSVLDAQGSSTVCLGLQNSHNVKVLDLHMKAATQGIIQLLHCSNVVVSNCWVKQSSQHGILIRNSTNLKVVANKVGDNTDANNNFGILLDGYSSRNYFFKNLIWRNGWAGIEIRNISMSNTILSNIIFRNAEEGIKVHAGTGGGPSIGNRILGNQIYSNNTSNGADKGGIRIIDNSDRTLIRNNEVFGNIREWNIGLRNVKNCVVSNNMVYNCVVQSGGENVGLGFWNVTNCLIKKNKIYGNPYHGIKMTDASVNNILENNRSFNNGYDGIQIFAASHHNRLYRNLFYKNNRDGLRTDSSQQTVVLNNTFFGNSQRGILFDNNSTSCTLRNNISQSNARSTGDYGYQTANGSSFGQHQYNTAYGNGNTGSLNFSFGLDATEIQSNARFQSTITTDSNFLYLSTDSACIDAGSPSDPVSPCDASVIDMGAVEYYNGGACSLLLFLWKGTEEDKGFSLFPAGGLVLEISGLDMRSRFSPALFRGAQVRSAGVNL